MHIIMPFLTVAVAGLVSACTTVQTFPENGSPAITQASEFGVMTAQPDTYKGRAVRMAGRIIGIEESESGTILLARWLPFPKYEGKMPGNDREGRVFKVLYPGRLDESARWLGNEFLAAGTMKGRDQFITITGLVQEVPALQAECLRIWKSAGDAPTTSDDPMAEDFTLPLAQTYCRES